MFVIDLLITWGSSAHKNSLLLTSSFHPTPPPETSRQNYSLEAGCFMLARGSTVYNNHPLSGKLRSVVVIKLCPEPVGSREEAFSAVLCSSFSEKMFSSDKTDHTAAAIVYKLASSFLFVLQPNCGWCSLSPQRSLIGLVKFRPVDKDSDGRWK